MSLEPVAPKPDTGVDVRDIHEYAEPNTSSSGVVSESYNQFSGAVPVYIRVRGASQTTSWSHPGSWIGITFHLSNGGEATFGKGLKAYEGGYQSSEWNYPQPVQHRGILRHGITGYTVHYGSSGYNLRKIEVDAIMWDLGLNA